MNWTPEEEQKIRKAIALTIEAEKLLLGLPAFKVGEATKALNAAWTMVQGLLQQ
jgi:hypothetical protein